MAIFTYLGKMGFPKYSRVEPSEQPLDVSKNEVCEVVSNPADTAAELDG
jgi:hypothetical protein